MRTNAEIADLNGENSDDDEDNDDESNDGPWLTLQHVTGPKLHFSWCSNIIVQCVDENKVGPEMMTVNVAMWEFSQNDAKR